jgi:hypothetical protein
MISEALKIVMELATMVSYIMALVPKRIDLAS